LWDRNIQFLNPLSVVDTSKHSVVSACPVPLICLIPQPLAITPLSLIHLVPGTLATALLSSTRSTPQALETTLLSSIRLAPQASARAAISIYAAPQTSAPADVAWLDALHYLKTYATSGKRQALSPILADRDGLLPGIFYVSRQYAPVARLPP